MKKYYTCEDQRRSRRCGKFAIAEPSRSGEGGTRRRRGQFGNERGMEGQRCGRKNMRWRERRDDGYRWHDQRASQMTKHAMAATLAERDFSRHGVAMAGHDGCIVVSVDSGNRRRCGVD